MNKIEQGSWKGTSWIKKGSGPPVILVHGLGLNSQMWQWQIASLTPHFSVICYDLLGHGNSEHPEIPCKLAQFNEQLLELMDGLKLKQSALVGFSLGGLIVQDFALSHPEKVSALVILNTAHGRTKTERKAVLDRVQQAKIHGPVSTVAAALQRWFSADFASQNPEILETIKGWILANDKVIYPEIYRVLAECDEQLKDAIKNIGCPTLVMTGEDDHGNSPEMTKRMAKLIPAARAVILPGLRHMGLAENPQAVNSVLVSFLQEIIL
ncbi:alpha/beta hydrolase [bacterium]|jgi:pimeloyl-ACP methyl ester carboxylesterase|nr:alpha/beta fold hydrolase [Deltaproteobacteria bacterium]MDB3917834.1 alpha/beta hydrolase [bacterium]